MGNEARMKHKFRCVSQKNLLIYLFRWFDAAKTSLESVFIITGKEGAIKGERKEHGGGVEFNLECFINAGLVFIILINDE